jgi:hypothetical protein
MYGKGYVDDVHNMHLMSILSRLSTGSIHTDNINISKLLIAVLLFF